MVDPAPLQPSEYPWQPIARPGVLVDGDVLPIDDPDPTLENHGVAPMRARHRVLAVGSNASAAVMHRKLARAGVAGPLPMTIERHDGLAIGHSAHVSLPGYIAAAPYRCGRCSRRLVVLHPDDDQLGAIDDTEPNYRRVDHDGAWVYGSRWQVLAISGLPLTLRSQADLHRALLDADPRFRRRFGDHDSDAITGSLAHDGSTNEWRHHWRAAGLTRPAGLG